MLINTKLKLISSPEDATKEHGLIITGKHPKLIRKTVPKRKFTPINFDFGKRFKHTISPINSKQKYIYRFGCIDIETISVDKIQYPIAISFFYMRSQNRIVSKIFLIDYNLFISNRNEAILLLWKNFFKFLMHNKVYSNCKTIFAHNLGSFDGYFIYKALMSHFELENVSMVVDDQNKFVCLQILKDSEIAITFKDSYRIFPVSLDKLCQSFNVEGKISKYNPDFNTVELFNNPELLKNFKEYALQDTIALYNALRKAQVEYFEKFQVDISTIYSTSTLSLKIFRNRFLTEDIAILSSKDDDFVRRGYLGGATDYFQEYAQNVHYYDVNSLYPFAMKMVLPNKPIARYNDMTNIPLDDFFGFALAEVTCPKDIKIPLLPYKDLDTNRTIHPVGKWTGVYYSEELKAAVKLGYEIKLIEGIRFSKFSPFNEYIDHFYNLKKNSDKNSGTYFISKMQLNQLYGIFGRRKTDTDSIFTTKPLDNDLIGKELGLMKDELNGAVIDEAYFFGIKKYGYRIGDQVTTVFAGIKRNSLTWGNILKIHIKQI